MYIQLDFESEIPIYEQLKNEIIIGIAKKQFLPGERLPSVRALAGDIGINLHYTGFKLTKDQCSDEFMMENHGMGENSDEIIREILKDYYGLDNGGY